MSVSHGHSTVGGVEYDDRDYVRRQKGERLILTRLINVLYGDAHQLMSMRGVGIAMQRMH